VSNYSIHQIYIEEWAVLFKEEDKRGYFAMQKQNSFSQMALMFLEASQLFRKAYTALMTHAEIKQIIKDQKIDLMLIDAFVTIPFPLADVLGVPVVGHYSNAGTLAIFNQMGISPAYASVPAGVIGFDDQMSFFQRMANMFSANALMAIIDLLFTSSLEQAHKENYPNSRSVSDMAKDMTIALVNSHPTTAWQRSLPPNVIPVGSVHTRPAKPLEQVDKI
jgi:glucuronosyltransferase